MSGVSVGWTRVPSKRKRTELGDFPWRSQKAVMSFWSLVERLILKKTSLLLSDTLMLRCMLSAAGASAGLPFSDMLGGCGLFSRRGRSVLNVQPMGFVSLQLLRRGKS